MPDYNRICVYNGPITGVLALCSIVYYCIVYYGGQACGHDGVYEEVIWLQGLLDDLGLIRINWRSIMIAWVLSISQRIRCIIMKHIDVRFHFVREILEEGDIELQNIHTKENPIDMLSKIVPGVKFAHCKELLHVLQVAWARWSSFGWTTDSLLPQTRGT